MPRKVLRAHEPGDEGYNFEVYKGQSDGATGDGAGPVTTTWLPEAFSWYGEKDRRASSGIKPFLSITKGGTLHLSKAAAKVLAADDQAFIAVGLNKKFIAVRVSENGFTFCRDKRSGAIYLTAKIIFKKMQEDGWPLPCRIPLAWDEKSKMLVGKKPATEEAAQAS